MPFRRSEREECCSRRVYGADSPEDKDGPEWDSGYQGGLNISRDEFLDEEGVPSKFEEGRSQSSIPQSHHRHISSTSGFNMKISIPVSRIYDASSQNSRSGIFPIEQDNSFRRSIDTEDSFLHNHSVSGFKNPYFISQENTSGKRMRSSDIFENGTMRQHKSCERQVSVKGRVSISPRKDRCSRSPRSSNSGPRLSSRELNSHSRKPLMDISPQREHRTESLVVELGNRSPIGENTCKVTVRSQINVPSNKKPNKDSQRRSRKRSPRTKSPTRDLLRSPIRNPRKSYIRDLRRSPIRVSKSSSVRNLRGSPIRDLRKLPISDVRSRSPIKDLRNKLPVNDRKSGHDYDQRTKLSCEDRLGSSSKKTRSPSLTKMSVKARLGSPVRKRRSKSLQRKTCRNSSDSSSKRSNDRRFSQRKRSRSPLKDDSLSELLRSARELDYLAKEKNELEKECMEFYQTKPKENEKEPEPRLRLVRVKDISLLMNPEPSSKDDMRTNALVGNIDFETNRKGFEILQNESAFEIEDPREDRTLPSTRLYPPLGPKADTGSGRKPDDRNSSRYGSVSRKDGKSSRISPRTLSPGRKRKSSREKTRSKERQEFRQTEQRKSTSMEKTVFTRLQPSLPREETDLQKKGKKSKKTRWSSGEDNMISGKSRDELILFSKPLPPPKAIILKKMALNIMTSQAANLASMAKTPTASLAQTLALAQAAALEKYKPSKEVLVAQMRNKIRNQRSLLNSKVSKSLEIPKLGSSEPLEYPEDIEDTTESSDYTAPAKSLMVHYCDYLRKKDKPLGYCDDMMTTWILAGIQDEKSLREYINMENPRSVDKLRVVLVQLITRIPGARIPKSVNVTDLLDQTIKFFVTENPDLYNNTETTSMNTEVSFLLDRTESQEPGYYTSEYLGGIGKSSNSQDMQTSHALVLTHSVYTGVFPDKSFPLFGRNIPDSTKPSQPSLGSSTLSFPPPVLAVEGIPRAQSNPFAPVNSKPQAFTSPPPPATLTSQPQPFTVPPPATLTSQPQPFTVPPPATLTSQPKPSIAPPPATFTSQSQPFSVPPPATLTSDPPVEKLTSQPQSYTAPQPVKVTSKPDSYLKTVSRSSKYKPWKAQTRCLRYLEPGIPQDENIGSVQSDSNLSSNFTQASNWSSYSSPCSNLQSYSTQGSNLTTYSTQDSNLPSCSTQASNLHSNSTSGSNLPTFSTQVSNLSFFSTPGSNLPTNSTQSSNLPNNSTPRFNMSSYSSSGPKMSSYSFSGPKMSSYSSSGPKMSSYSSSGPKMSSYSSSGPNLKTYSTTGSILPNYSTQVSNLPTSSTTTSGKPTYANLFSFSKSVTLPPLTMSTESTPRYEPCPGKLNTSHLQTVGSTQISYSTPGSTVPSFFNSNTLPKPGGPTQKLFTNSLPQHAYTILQNIFGTDPTFSAKYASLQDLYEYFSKKFSVMTNFGYDGSYIEGLARGGRELLARAGWNISSLRQLWLSSGRDGVTARNKFILGDEELLLRNNASFGFSRNSREEFSDLNCDSDEGPEEPVLCYYCDTQLPGPEDVSSHMTRFHNIIKHLDFILEVTSRRQKQDFTGAEPISPEPFTSNPTKEILDDISDIESEEEEGKGKVEIKEKDEIKTEKEDEEEIKEGEKKEENPSKPIELEIDNTNMEAESKDEGEEKRDWMYSTEKAVFDILSDQELNDDAENDSRCVKCDLEHVKGKPCHFLLKNGKSTDDKERDKDIRGKKGSNQDKDIRSKLNSNQGRGKGDSGRGRGFVRQGIVGDKLRKIKLSGVRKVRVAPPRSDLEKGRAKSVRTLPPSLYNNPDALSSKSRSWRDHDKFEESSYRRSRSPSRSRSPRTFDSSRKSRSQDYRGLRSPSPDRIGWRQNEKRFGDRGRYELEEEPRRDTSQGGWRDDWRIGERCELCKKENHASEDCPNYFCNKCHTQGHFAKFCTADKSFSASSSFSHPPRALPIQQELWVQPRGSQSYPANENPSYPGGTSFSGGTNYLGAGAGGSSYLGAGDTSYPGAGGTSNTGTGGISYTGAGSGAASYPGAGSEGSNYPGAGSGGSSYPGSGARGEPGYPGSQFSHGFNPNNPQSLPGYSGASTGYQGSGYSSYGPGAGYQIPSQESGFPADNRGSGYGQSSYPPLNTASDPSSASYSTSSWRGGSKL